MLKYRIISFPLLLLLLWVVFFFPNRAVSQGLFAIPAAVLVGFAVYEGAKLLLALKLPCYPVFCGVAGGLYVLYYCLVRMLYFELSLSLALLGIALLALPNIIVLFKFEKAFRRIIGSFGVLISLGVPLALVVDLYFTKLAGKVSLLLFVIVCTKAMDTGGYILGMLTSRLPNGNHKIAPQISPKKSWEGFFGGLALSLGCAWGFAAALEGPWGVYLGAAAVLAVASFFGDLSESAVKRRAQVKDSGSWIPGMGGALDVVDSFLYVGIVCTIGLTVNQLFQLF